MERTYRTPFAWLGWASGIIYIALFLADIVLTPGEPDPGTPVKQIAAFYTSHHAGILTTSLLHDLSGIFFLVFLSTLIVALSRGQEGPVLPVLSALGAVVAGSVAYISYVSAGAAAYLAGNGGAADTIGALALLRYIASNVAVVPLAVFLGAASLAVIRQRIIARWIGWLGLLTAGAEVLSIFGLYDASSPLGLIGFIGAILFAVWILAVSIALLVRGTRSSVSEPQTART